jgi:hypothetical protein
MINGPEWLAEGSLHSRGRLVIIGLPGAGNRSAATTIELGVEPLTRWTSEPFRGSWAVLTGRITWARLRGPDFRRLEHDVYVGAAADRDTRMRVRALRLWSQERGVVGGPLAARAYGAECPWDDADLIMPGRCHPAPTDARIRTGRLRPGEIAQRFGCPVTTPVRTAFDLARREPLAVAAVDSLANTCRLSVEHLRGCVADHAGARGLVQVRRVLELMDPRAESIPETGLRLGLLDRGVPPAVPQFDVVLASGRRIRLDLAWVRAMLALEYDGPEHRTITGQNRDAFRDARLHDLGWEVWRVTSAMLLDPAALDELAARIVRRLARSGLIAARNR